MNKIKFYKSALFLVTLFLSGGFPGSIFGQQNSEKATAPFSSEPVTLKSMTAKNSLRALLAKPATAPSVAFPAANAAQTSAPYVRPNKDERFKKYLKRTFGGYALLGNVATAAFAQITDEPEEWENNAKGFGRRLASSVGRNVIAQTVIYGLDESFKLDSNYYKSGSKKIKDRFKNAFLSTFTARKPDGRRVFGAPRIAGIYTSAIIANQFWYPSRYDYKDGFSSGTISLGTSVAVNFLREFF